VLEWALKNDDQLELFEEEYLSGCLTWGYVIQVYQRKSSLKWIMKS